MLRTTLSTVRLISLSLLAFVLLGYSLFQGSKLLRGPVIRIDSPQNGATYNSPLIEVKGRAENVSYIYLDDRQIFTDKNGYFSEKLLLLPGYTIIKLDGKDKFGTKTEKKVEVILKEY